MSCLFMNKKVMYLDLVVGETFVKRSTKKYLFYETCWKDSTHWYLFFLQILRAEHHSISMKNVFKVILEKYFDLII